MAASFRITEIAVPTRYFPEAPTAGVGASCIDGLRILATLLSFTLHRLGLRRSRRYDSLRALYTRLQ